MKKIGIIFAMNEELNELLRIMSLKRKYSIYDLTFYECDDTNNNNKCILVESGIGKVNAARATQILIDNEKVDYIFNIGVAGALTDTINICDMVIGEQFVQHDFDLTPFNYKKGIIPNLKESIKSDNYLISLTKDIPSDTAIHYGVIASGDQFINDKTRSNSIRKNFGASCVEMEGAAIAQVCHLCNIPF